MVCIIFRIIRFLFVIAFFSTLLLQFDFKSCIFYSSISNNLLVSFVSHLNRSFSICADNFPTLTSLTVSVFHFFCSPAALQNDKGYVDMTTQALENADVEKGMSRAGIFKYLQENFGISDVKIVRVQICLTFLFVLEPRPAHRSTEGRLGVRRFRKGQRQWHDWLVQDWRWNSATAEGEGREASCSSKG
jgi:hypothetical protein